MLPFSMSWTQFLRRIAVCGAGLFFSLSTLPADAQVVVEWENPVDGDWFDANRWAGGVVPNGAAGGGFIGVVGLDAAEGGNAYEVTLGADANLVQLRID